MGGFVTSENRERPFLCRDNNGPPLRAGMGGGGGVGVVPALGLSGTGLLSLEENLLRLRFRVPPSFP